MEHIWKVSKGRACQNTFRRIFLLLFFVHPCPTPTLVYFFFFPSGKWEGATGLGSGGIGLLLEAAAEDPQGLWEGDFHLEGTVGTAEP